MRGGEVPDHLWHGVQLALLQLLLGGPVHPAGQVQVRAEVAHNLLTVHLHRLFVDDAHVERRQTRERRRLRGLVCSYTEGGWCDPHQPRVV